MLSVGWGKSNGHQNWHQAFAAISRATRDFQVQWSSEVEDFASVRRLISYIARERGVSPEAPLNISLAPPEEEVRHAAFQRLRAGLIAIGGSDPESIDCGISPDELVPRTYRQVKCNQL